MDELWNNVKNRFDVCLPFLHSYCNIIDKISTIHFKEIPNILLYGPHGIPFDFIWETIMRKKFGEYTKTKHIWRKDIITYYETPYFFEIDLMYPHQTKDMDLFSEFIKNIIEHPCIHEDRHIIILKGLDQISDKLRSTALRVLLERYSKNAFFVCTTAYIGQIEPPLRSRFLLIRCPIFTIDEIENCLNALGRIYHPLLKQAGCYDFYYALFISWLAEHYPEDINESICFYKLPFFHEFLLTTQDTLPSMEDIRKITQKISIHDGSFNMIAHDLLLFYKNESDILKYHIVEYCTEIDHSCSMTEEYRKPLYIEYLLHNIFYNKPVTMKDISKQPTQSKQLTQFEESSQIIPEIVENTPISTTTLRKRATRKRLIINEDISKVETSVCDIKKEPEQIEQIEQTEQPVKIQKKKVTRTRKVKTIQESMKNLIIETTE